MDDLRFNLKIFTEKFKTSLKEEFEDLKNEIQENAEEKVPVRTGKLKKSIQFDVVQNEDEISIKLDTKKLEKYWAHVEFGTSRQKPQPYLRPAIEYGKKQLKEKLQRAFVESTP